MKNILLILLALALTLIPSLNPSHAKTSPDKSSVAVEMPISVNKATVEQLTQLKGLGLKKAEAIVTYRDKFGPFKRIEDLVNVKGIGSKFLEKNAAYLSL